MLRLSIGIETVDDIIRDLAQARQGDSVTAQIGHTRRSSNAQQSRQRPSDPGRARRWAICCGASGCPPCSAELPERDGPPKKIKILGEDLLAFRATDGRVGIVEPHCPHRGATASITAATRRCGIRLRVPRMEFDVDGNCVDLPTSPPESTWDTIKLRLPDARDGAT